nr:MAG TPA: hypothetical protein [Caudoviricetes sp.]
MKISVWDSFGSYSRSVDVEFNSESVSDCAQAEKYIFACVGGKTGPEVTEDAETGSSTSADG